MPAMEKGNIPLLAQLFSPQRREIRVNAGVFNSNVRMKIPTDRSFAIRLRAPDGVILEAEILHAGWFIEIAAIEHQRCFLGGFHG